jgi:hypothetical protein
MFQMKKIITTIVFAAICVSAGAAKIKDSDWKMNCKSVGSYYFRCENIEVVCYHRGDVAEAQPFCQFKPAATESK